MASSYSSSLNLELQATGENSGSWGTKTNNNLQVIQLQKMDMVYQMMR